MGAAVFAAPNAGVCGCERDTDNLELADSEMLGGVWVPPAR